MLQVRELTTFYGASQALFGMELAVEAGEVVTLMGRNGMGKTTTVLSIMGMIGVRRGVIEFDGTRVERLPSFRIARLGLGLVPEGRHIFPQPPGQPLDDRTRFRVLPAAGRATTQRRQPALGR